MVHRAAVASLLIAAVVAVASCGANTSAPGAPTPTVTTDPAVTAAAAAVQPVLEQSFANTFAGLELRHDAPTLTIYRKPDPRLDTEVSRIAPGVRVEFRDAKYTLVEMKAAGERVMDDRDYWKGRGMAVVAVTPAVDGSGVQVLTSNEADDLVGALRERYPVMSFTIRKGGDIVHPMYTGPPIVFNGTPPVTTK